jgi:hypothetical protein
MFFLEFAAKECGHIGVKPDALKQNAILFQSSALWR